MAARQAPEIDIWIHPEERGRIIALAPARQRQTCCHDDHLGSAVMNLSPALVVRSPTFRSSSAQLIDRRNMSLAVHHKVPSNAALLINGCERNSMRQS